MLDPDRFIESPADDYSLHYLACTIEAAELFMKIRKQHGIAMAKQIFAALGEPSAKERREYGEMQAFHFFEMCRREGLNLEQISRKLAVRNKATSTEHRWGPRGSTDHNAIRMWLKRLLKKQGIDATKPWPLP